MEDIKKIEIAKNLNEYYSKRASEYEAVYHRPDKTRLAEQKFIAGYA